MIKIGDIVERSRFTSAENESLLNSILFNEGYFLVLSVSISKITHKTGENIMTCLIMDTSGIKAWIDKRSIRIVLEL